MSLCGVSTQTHVQMGQASQRRGALPVLKIEWDSRFVAATSLGISTFHNGSSFWLCGFLATNFKTLLAAFIIFSAGGGCFVFCLAFAKACSHSLMMTWDDRMMTFWHRQLPTTLFHGIAIYHAWDSTLPTDSLSKDQACFSPLYMKSNVSMQMLGTLDNMCNSSSKHKSPTEPFFFSLDGMNRQKTPHLRRYVSN